VLELPDNWFEGKPCRKCKSTLRYVSCNKCAECRRKYWQTLSRAHPRNELHRKLGITREIYFELLEDQDWSCAICRKMPKTKLDTDHCHKTGKYRGMLCKACNTALGKFKDNPALLLRAADYLKKGGFKK
jgi:ferredoxin